MKRLAILLLPACLAAQKTPPAAPEPKPTSITEVLNSMPKRKACENSSVVSNVSFRCIGPSVMSGRVVDIDANPADPTVFYVAYASGGVWFTKNNGTTFTPVFDEQATVDIGDIAVNWDDQSKPELWVGTGECNSSRSSYAGYGVFHSMDGGKTWENTGLQETHHIGKIIISPADKKRVWVAAIGHLYTPNKERGVFRTDDGGHTWKQTLFIDENTGVIDMFPDPSNAATIYAIAWHRERKAWNFTEGGSSSGIYKSTNGGESWMLITGPKSGFPQGDGVGRIGMNIFPGNGNTIYAIVDNQTTKTDTTKKKGLAPADFRKMTREQFLVLDPARLKKFLTDNDFPEKYSVAVVTDMVKNGKILPSSLADYVSDANSDLFSKPIVGPEIYRSDDAGATWKKVNEKQLDGLFYTYGYYFGKIWVAPYNVNEIYIAGVELLKSTDGGKTFESTNGINQHGDHHALWIDPVRKGHIINGNDGGVNISWDDGETWFKANTPDVGQFYSVNVDMAEPYTVYGGLQDNGGWCGPANYTPSLAWYDDGNYPWKRIMDGDGMQVQVDTRDNNTIYAGYQFGHYFRVNKTTGETKTLWPEIELGDKPLRFNWQAPILLSTHNMDILYLGAQRLYRSLDKGDHFTAISPDLTRGGRTGDVPYGTLSTISESPKKFGLIYTGSDDGLIYVTKDGGNNWTRISDKLPQHMRINRVIASAHQEGRVYAVLSGFQWDNFKAMLYVSEDYGTTWKQLGLDLPMEPLNIIREDPVNENLIFAGTDHGLYVSFSRGVSFMRMTGGLPPVAVHDLMIQTREHDLVVGTHGRSIWICNITEMELMSDSILHSALYAFAPGEIKQWRNYTTVNGEGTMYSATTAGLAWFVPSVTTVTIEIRSADGKFLFATLRDTCEKGLNFFNDEILVDSACAPAFKEWTKLNDKRAKELDHNRYAFVDGTYQIRITTAEEVTQNVKLVISSGRKQSETPGIPNEPGESGFYIDK